jgi:hypothetical protein
MVTQQFFYFRVHTWVKSIIIQRKIKFPGVLCTPWRYTDPPLGALLPLSESRLELPMHRKEDVEDCIVLNYLLKAAMLQEYISFENAINGLSKKN